MTAVLTLDHVSKSYGTKVAVRDLSLSLPGGEIFGILGPNGAGKTTTFKMVVGLLQPTEGEILVGGMDVTRAPIETKRLIGFVPDTPTLYEKLSAMEYLQFVGDLFGISRRHAHERGMELLRLFDLEDNAEDLIDSFSHGMKQKIVLAGALLHEPQLLILDEPTVGLDPRSARLIKDILRQLTHRGVTVILSTHILEIAERMCDRIGILNQGELIAIGTMEELRSGAADRSLEDIFLQLTGGAEYAALMNAD